MENLSFIAYIGFLMCIAGILAALCSVLFIASKDSNSNEVPTDSRVAIAMLGGIFGILSAFIGLWLVHFSKAENIFKMQNAVGIILVFTSFVIFIGLAKHADARSQVISMKAKESIIAKADSKEFDERIDSIYKSLDERIHWIYKSYTNMAVMLIFGIWIGGIGLLCGFILSLS
jgi:heme A synthase